MKRLAAIGILAIAATGCSPGPIAARQHASACFVEPSDTAEGFEVILYPDRSTRTITEGFEVSCPH